MCNLHDLHQHVHAVPQQTYRMDGMRVNVTHMDVETRTIVQRVTNW